jgi:glucoamylase
VGRGDRPDRRLKKGQPAGSAVPLVWAHAEYLKLLRSAVDGKVFDRIEPVYERYCTPEGRKKCKRGVEMYSRSGRFSGWMPGSTLRILDEGMFEVVWSDDGWKTVKRTASRGLGSAGFSADISRPAGCAELEWTMHWTESDTWLGYNVKVKVDGKLDAPWRSLCRQQIFQSQTPSGANALDFVRLIARQCFQRIDLFRR